jgi:uncharacterized membrane protein
LIIVAIGWVDGLIPYKIPGLGLLTVLVVTTVVGMLANSIIAKPLFDLLNDVIKKIPLVNFIYSSLNDVIGAVAGEKKRFNQPVLVPFDQEGVLMKPGFVTDEDLAKSNLEDYIAVYMPHSYNFSGNVFLVRKDKIITLEGNNSDTMKYIVSGGVSGSLKKKL